MPGAYAHITAVNKAKERARGKLSSPSLRALGENFHFAELGCVSPDYPYLAVNQGYWADQMHYRNTATFLRSAVSEVAQLPESQRSKAVAWLLGFACHVAADMTIHPVVEGIVGRYEDNKSAHRLCEMHQDAFIFPTLNAGPVNVTNHLATGIGACSQAGNSLALDGTIKTVWLNTLDRAYPDAAKDKARAPNPDSWHLGFTAVLKAAGGAARLFPFARHVAAGQGLVYPERADVQERYVKQLKTPEGVMDYQDVFERALNNIVEVWRGIDSALASSDLSYLDALEDWNLDTGRTVSSKRLVFWSSQ
jgi:hypothetical protein